MGALVRSSSGLGFAAGDIDRFRKQGSDLAPDALLVWIRDLSTLAITLRNDIMASGAADQIEQGLIEPLCRVLETHVNAAGVGSGHGNAVEELVKAERRKHERPAVPAEGVLATRPSTVGAYLRGRRRKDP